MARFSKEQIEILERSPHVALVSETTIMFKPEFKRYLQEQKQQGRRIREVLLEQGIDPQILGGKRIENLSYRLKQDTNEENWSVDGRSTNGRTTVSPDEEMDLEARVRWLTHELEYTRQEVAFLKKLQMANTEARKAWESKHQPK